MHFLTAGRMPGFIYELKREHDIKMVYTAEKMYVGEENKRGKAKGDREQLG